jgi:hypothetical protein
MSSFNTSAVNEIKTVIKYILIQYREENNLLIRTMRHLEGENAIFPNYSNKVSTTSSSTIYQFFRRWKNSNGVTASRIVPNTNATYYAENIIVNIPLEASMQVTGDSEENQSMINNFDISSSINLYLKNISYLGYIVKPTCTYHSSGVNKVTRISFKIQNFIHSVGTTKTLEPEFMLYANSAFTEEIDKVTIKITVRSSGQSTGD